MWLGRLLWLVLELRDDVCGEEVELALQLVPWHEPLA